MLNSVPYRFIAGQTALHSARRNTHISTTFDKATLWLRHTSKRNVFFLFERYKRLFEDIYQSYVSLLALDG